MQEKELLDSYPPLKPEDVRAALAYASVIARGSIIPVKVEK